MMRRSSGPNARCARAKVREASFNVDVSRKKIAVVKSFPPLAERFVFDEPATGWASAICNSRHMIFRQGDPPEAVYYLQKGEVHLTVVAEDGKERIIAMLRAGAFFGEGCLAGQSFHMASAIATVVSTVVRIELPTMIKLLREKASFGQMFMAFLLSRNVELEADLVDHLFNASERRLARALLMLANMNTGSNSDATIPKINQESLAARVGTTRSRVNLFMNKFRKLGFIDYSNAAGGGLIVHPSLLNAVSMERPMRATTRPVRRMPSYALAA